jgi:NAD(P)-dependent dehydrogenase (short-subunit alcohol dehydrogenase family)
MPPDCGTRCASTPEDSPTRTISSVTRRYHRSRTTDEFSQRSLSLRYGETVGQSGQHMNGVIGTLRGKNVVVLGASRGVGRETVRRAFADGACVLAVARGSDGLRQLENEMPGIQTLALDAAADHAPPRVFDTLSPDVMVVCGGAIPTPGPIHKLSWIQFGTTWQTDVKMSFSFCGQALRTPLAPGSTVILISSGAGIHGSPISGGYAGAKRMQMFLASYCQKESARLGLGIRFAALVPMRLMPETDLGKAAVEGYAQYLRMNPAEFVECMTDRQSAADVAAAVVRIATQREIGNGTVFTVSAEGISLLS